MGLRQDFLQRLLSSSEAQGLVREGLPGLIEEIEVRSAFSPPQRINVKQALQEPGPGSAKGPAQLIAARVKPTIILRGPLVKDQVVAPWGATDTESWKVNLGLLGLGGLLAGLLACKLLRVVW